MDCGTAISNITKGKDKKNDTMIIMTPFANWESFLTPAPYAIALLGELLTISSKTDFDLRENMPVKGFEYIKYPDSFRACLVQVANSGWRAFNEAHTCMDQIRLTTSNVDTHIREAVRILMAGTPIEVEKVLPLTLRNVEQIADESLEQAQRIENKFLFVMNLTEELLEASSNTKSVYERKQKDTLTKIEVAKIEQKRAEEAKKEREKRYENMQKQIEKAQEQYEKSVKDMPGSCMLLGISFTEGLIDSVKSITSLPADIVRGLGSGSYHLAHDLTSRRQISDNSQTAAPKKSYNAEVAEYNVFCIVPDIDNLISTLQSIIGSQGSEPNTNRLKEELGMIIESFIDCQRRVVDEKESGPVGNRACKVCAESLQICEDSKRLYDSLTKITDSKVESLQRKLDKLRKDSMILAARANKVLGRNPLDEQSPCLHDKRATNQASNVMTMTMESARFKTEVAKENLRDARERADAAENQLEQASERMCAALKTMQTLNIESVDFESIRKTLQEGITALAEVRAQWGQLVVFFEEISNMIKCCMKTSLKKFVETAKVGRELKNENQVMSKAFRANMYDQTLQASRISYVVSTIAGAYVEISRDHLMGQVTGLARLLGIDGEKQKDKMIQAREQLHVDCEKAQIAIKQKIKKQHQEYEDAVDARIAQIEREVEAIMPPQENLPAIQDAVKTAFSDEDFGDLVG